MTLPMHGAFRMGKTSQKVVFLTFAVYAMKYLKITSARAPSSLLIGFSPLLIVSRHKTRPTLHPSSIANQKETQQNLPKLFPSLSEGFQFEKQIFYVIETKVHESWNGDPVDGYDIALLKLDRKANSTLPNLSAIVETVSSGTELIALDWRDDDANKLTDSLQMFVDLTFVSRDRCENLLGRDLEEHQFCAGFFTQSCQGDVLLFSLAGLL